MGRQLPLIPRSDFIQRLSQSSPIDAIEELIWNGLDEAATTVVVSFELSPIKGVDKISIEDNGKGLEFLHADDAFGGLGSSRKRTRHAEAGILVHGRLGQGRHKAFSIGAKVVWEFVYLNEMKEKFRFKIEGTAGQDKPFYLHDEARVSDSIPTGCKVTITGIQKPLTKLLDKTSHSELTGRFAFSLIARSDLTITYNGRVLNPKDAIKKRRAIRSPRLSVGGREYDVSITAIDWHEGHKHREACLCGASGIPLHKLVESFLFGADQRSVFIQSELFDEFAHGEPVGNH